MYSKKILFLINEDWYFLSHKLPIALAAQKHGFNVVIACRFIEDETKISSFGFDTIHIDLKRENKNPFRELQAIINLFKIIKNQKPWILHNFTFKHILYGSILGRILSVPQIVNSFSGLGMVFHNDSLFYKLSKGIYEIILKSVFKANKIKTIVQNQNDYQYLLSRNITIATNTFLIKGSGINSEIFKPQKKNILNENIKVAFASRLIWDKGLEYFIKAARNIQKRRNDINFVIMGKIDVANPNSINSDTIMEWVNEGIVSWEGHVPDMHSALLNVDIIVLPTIYGEGVPKILIEAASCEIPIIATDWPGCREIVIHEENGLLVEPKNIIQIEEAVIRLADSVEERKRMGKRGRELVIEEFIEEIVTAKTMKVYNI